MLTKHFRSELFDDSDNVQTMNYLIYKLSAIIVLHLHLIDIEDGNNSILSHVFICDFLLRRRLLPQTDKEKYENKVETSISEKTYHE